jgi:hypothetical protein
MYKGLYVTLNLVNKKRERAGQRNPAAEEK